MSQEMWSNQVHIAADGDADIAGHSTLAIGFGACLLGVGVGLASRRQRGVACASSVGPISATTDSTGRSAETPLLRMGTRGSPLALAQAHMTKRILAETFPELAPDSAVQIRVISTEGDQRLDIALSELGGKGLFTKELDAALISGEVDFCVHSTKDVPTTVAEGTELCTMLPREDARDVIICRDPSITQIEDLPAGSVIGTASLRRQAQILAKNPGVRCVNFRGNVQTRLRKLKAGDVDATLLAYAGLKRMSMEQHATRILDMDEMLPAVSQGAIGIQCRSNDARVKSYLRSISHADTMRTVACERSFLAVLDGNCKTPIAGQANIIGDELHFRGFVASPDGSHSFEVELTGPVEDAEAIGRTAGLEVRKKAGEAFFEDMQEYVQDMQAANTKPAHG